MKAIVLVCLLAVANANILDDLNDLKMLQNSDLQLGKRHPLQQQDQPERLDNLMEWLRNSGLLFVNREADHLTNNINQELMAVMDKVKESVEGADTIAKNLKASLKAVEAGLANRKDVKELAKMVLSTVTKDVSTMIAQGTYDHDLEKMFDKVVSNAVAKQLMSRHSRRFLVDGLLTSVVKGLTDAIGDLFSLLGGTEFGNLKRFFNEIDGASTDLRHPTLANLKNLATTFLNHAGTATASTAMEAVKFFEPFKEQLGSLFTQIQSVAQNLAA